MKLHDIHFPVYKLPSYNEIDVSKLNVIKVNTKTRSQILDNPNIDGDTLAERRLKLKLKKANLYKLQTQVTNLRQLVKFPTGSLFIDNTGKLFVYRRSTKRFNIKPHFIERYKIIEDTTVFWIDGVAYILPYNIEHRSIKYALIMETDVGPFLYDLTSIKPKEFKKAI